MLPKYMHLLISVPSTYLSEPTYKLPIYVSNVKKFKFIQCNMLKKTS
jgi:hypothetical protein